MDRSFGDEEIPLALSLPLNPMTTRTTDTGSKVVNDLPPPEQNAKPLNYREQFQVFINAKYLRYDLYSLC